MRARGKTRQNYRRWAQEASWPGRNSMLTTRYSLPTTFKKRHAGEYLALQKLEARAAASGAVGDLVRDLEFLGGRRRVTPADHRDGAERGRLGDRGGHRPRGAGKLFKLEHARRAAPDDCLRSQGGRAIDRYGVRAVIAALPAVGNARGVRRGLSVGLGVDPVGTHVVDREDEF